MGQSETLDLRAQADRKRREEAELRGLADGLRRKADRAALDALALEDQLRRNGLPSSHDDGASVVIADAPSEEALARSADPDAVERIAVEATQAARVQPATEAHQERTAKLYAQIAKAWIEERDRRLREGERAEKWRIDDTIANRFSKKKRTIERATKPIRDSK
jgi:hypothetical protein